MNALTTAVPIASFAAMLAVAIWSIARALRSRARWVATIGVLILATPLLYYGLLIAGPFFPYAFDSVIGYELRKTVELSDYTATLRQFPGEEFYFTELLLGAQDGTTAQIVIDPDDDRWWHPRVIRTGSSACFLSSRNQGIADADACVDTGNRTIMIRRNSTAEDEDVIDFDELTFR